MSDEGLAPGKRLSEIRQQQGLSQRRAAELSGLTHSAISTIEQDKVSPAISTLQKLLKVYGLSLSEFFSEPEKPDEPQVVIKAFSTTRARCASPERVCCWKRALPMNS